MRYLKKWYILLLIFYIALNIFASCSRSYKANRKYKKMLKRRKTASVKRYKSPHQRKIAKKTIPINKNYVIKNQKRRPPRGPYR